MDNKSKWEKICMAILQVIPIFIILTICLYHLPDNKVIRIIGDEYGYWAAGSYIAGLDWSEITSVNAYYGYGYGFILAIILKLTSSMVTAYQVALILNVVFLCSIYFIALKLVKAFDGDNKIPWYMQIIISFSSIVYTSNVVYTQFTLTEVLLAFLYWLLVYLAYLLMQQLTFRRAILFEIVSVYSLCVHMRMVGIFVSCNLFLIYILWKNKCKLVKYLPLLGLTVVLLIAFYIMKDLYQNAWYTGDNEAMLAVNEVSGQLGKIKYLFSLGGCLSFCTALLGKIFYAFSASFLIIGIVLIAFVKKIYLAKKEKKEEDQRNIFSMIDALLLFLILSTFFMMVIGSISMIDYSGRFDLLTYGRYFEFTLSPLILVSLKYLYNVGIGNIKGILFLIVGYLSTALFINQIQDYSLSKSNMFIVNTGIVSTLIKLGYHEGSFLFLAVRGVLVFIVVLCIILMHDEEIKRILYSTAMIIISVFWIHSALYGYRNACLSWSIPEQDAEMRLSEYIEQEQIGSQLYYYYLDDPWKADVLQFLLKNHTIHCIKDVAPFINNKQSGYILTPINTKIEKKLYKSGYSIIQETKLLKLWAYK